MTAKLNQIDNPDIDDVAELAARGVVAEIRTSFPAKIIKYDKDKGRATVAPVIRGRRWDPVEQEIIAYLPKKIAGVPVLQNETDQGGLHVPYKRGDYVLVTCSERSIAEWKMEGGDDTTPASTERFKARDAIVVGPIRPRTNPAPSGNVHGSNPVLSGDPVLLGDSTAINFVALANLCATNYANIAAEFAQIVLSLAPLATAWNTASSAGGGPLIVPGATPLTVYAPTYTPTSVAASKVKAK